MPSSRKTPLKDRAGTAPVSTASVLFAGIGKERQAGKETARRTWKVVRAANYRPAHAVRSLRNGNSPAAGPIVSAGSDLFFSLPARVPDNETTKRGYTVLARSSDENAGKIGLANSSGETLSAFPPVSVFSIRQPLDKLAQKAFRIPINGLSGGHTMQFVPV